ncbi:hypothetical protein GYMLUDRAFT_100644 [Collybiopsis luxurians FD-317 M1]|uniref:Cytochrome P450 n=1 Tax=Collybiopsis luxurians FD-317 M1 TaxID=944289 RepID=A0A0D0BDP6_9AGAR|nr:hypothetical protein GYMLUDRAFT_100644 [Collybiopsis luxurians FD-317 M1]
MTSYILGALIALFLSILLARRVWIRFVVQRGLPLPPGPKGWPIIGNLFEIPKEKAHLQYTKMSQTYQSDLIYLNAAGTPILVLNSEDATSDLLVERFQLYSDRPQGTMGILSGVDASFVFCSYSDEWRKQRSLFMQEVSPSNLQMYQKPCMQECVSRLLNNLLDTPEKFEEHIHLLYAETILSMAFGISNEDSFEYYVNLSKVGMDAVSDVTAFGAYVVDTIPFLKYLPEWLPGMGFKKQAAYSKKLIHNMMREPLQFVKKKMEIGATVKPSMASRQLQTLQDNGTLCEETETLLSNILGTLYGGMCQMSSTTRNIILAFLLYPDVQKKGQAAVDAVVGFDRLPDYNDEGKIPYVEALVMEVLRWRVMLPLGVAHCTRTDDIYRGYYIPAKTVVLGNTWAILHNTVVYGEDVDEFRPERFLNPDGTLDKNIPYPSAAFGYGRRVCAGKVMAQSALWITVASLLACFNFSRARNAEGEEIEPSTDPIEGLITYCAQSDWCYQTNVCAQSFGSTSQG